MRKFSITIEPATRFSWGKQIPACESRKDYKKHEEENWKGRAHIVDGVVSIPSVAFKQALVEAAKYDGRVIPGAGKKTYTKLFERAVQVTSTYTSTGKNEDALTEEWLFVSSDGKKGSASRSGKVWKKFPILEADGTWTATFELTVCDQRLTKELVKEFSTIAGFFIGLGRWRPENGGSNGMFSIKEVKVSK